MKHVFVIKTKQKSSLYSEFLHTHIGKTSVIPVHASCLCLRLWPKWFIQLLFIIRCTHSWKTPEYSFTGGWSSYAPMWQKLLSALSARAGGTFAPSEWNLLLITHSLWGIKLLLQSLLTSHLQCSWLSMHDDRVVCFYKALTKRSISSATVILSSKRGVVSRPSS